MFYLFTILTSTKPWETTNGVWRSLLQDIIAILQGSGDVAKFRWLTMDGRTNKNTNPHGKYSAHSEKSVFCRQTSRWVLQ